MSNDTPPYELYEKDYVAEMLKDTKEYFNAIVLEVKEKGINWE
ncbi:MAG: hypothetical protein ACOCXG_00690 [Nanoarchaeota archaeon]